MTNRAAIKLVWDALRAAELVAQFVEGATQADFHSDKKLRSAVERQFTIMGEALARLRREVPSMAANVPDLQAIIGFRNRLIHGYDSVDDGVVWASATADLPRAVAALEAALRDLQQK